MKKRIVIDVDDEFKERVFAYSRANGRSVTALMKLAALQYMRQNPVVKDGEHEFTEK